MLTALADNESTPTIFIRGRLNSKLFSDKPEEVLLPPITSCDYFFQQDNTI